MDYTYVSKQEQVPDVIRWLGSKKVVAFDIETGPRLDLVHEWEKNSAIGLVPHKAHIATVQIGDDEKQWIIDLRAGLDITFLKKLVESEEIAKVGVNLKFDSKMVMHHWKVLPRKLVDCMIMEQVLRAGMFPGRQDDSNEKSSRIALKFTGLKALAERYLDIDLDKDKELRTNLWKTPVDGFDERQLLYMAGDIKFPLQIAKLQKPAILERGLHKIIALEHRLIPVIANMELVGIPFDLNYWNSLLQDHVKDQNKAIDILDEYLKKTSFMQEDMFGESVKVSTVEYGSSQKLAKALHKAGFKGFVDKHGKPLSVASQKLKLMKIEGEMPAELVDAIIDYKKISKRVSSYGANFIEAVDNETHRIHPDFTQTILVTGRMSCSPGMQTIPQDADYRRAFYAPQGWALIVLDASQIEARISADKTKDEPAIAVFQSGGDIYKEDGQVFYNTTIDKNTPEGKKLRNLAKTAWLGLSYGQGKEKFHTYSRLFLGEDLPKHDTDFLYDKFFELHWRMKEVMDEWSSYVDPIKSFRYITDPFVHTFMNEEKSRAKLMEIFLDRKRGNVEAAEKIVNKLMGQKNECRYAETALGRKRYFRSDFVGWWTAGRNLPIQGTAADLQKATILGFQEMHWNKKFDAHIINVVHDETITLVREDQAEDLYHMQVNLGEQIGQEFLTYVPMKVDGGITKVWKKF